MTKIPEGFSSVTPYIVMDDVAAALEFYAGSLGAEEKLRMPGADGKVIYAEMQVGNARIMMGAPDPVHGGQSAKSMGGSPVSFFVYVPDVQAAFDKAKAAGMKEKKAIDDMFWGDRMGTLSDEFNIEWTIAQHIRDVSPEEIAEAMKKMGM